MMSTRKGKKPSVGGKSKLCSSNGDKFSVKILIEKIPQLDIPYEKDSTLI